MKRMAMMLLAAAMFAMPAMAADWKNAAVTDKMCSTKVKADPDSHTRACALQCKGSGFGVVTEKGDFLAFDEEGNKQMTAALEASKKKDHIRADITGTQDGNTIHVEKLSIH